MKIKLSDYVVDFLVKKNINTCFSVTGGGAMHLNHSFALNPKTKIVYNHHEQACTVAAESYFRLNNQIAIANVTSGPGGTNAITGVYGAYVDSIPMIVISGQVKLETTVYRSKQKLRQLGDQEINIIPLVSSITKYSTMITNPLRIKFALEKALHEASNGRPGPVWIDIPLDIQSKIIDTSLLKSYTPKSAVENTNIESKILRIYREINKSQRPVILAGNGIRLSDSFKEFNKLVSKLRIPVTTAFNGHDVISETSKLYIGRPGTVGDRAGNFTVQNSDLLIVLGSRLNIRQISYNYKSFARFSKIIYVDIDKTELCKETVQPFMKVECDLKFFINKMLSSITLLKKDFDSWIKWCRVRKNKYPVVLDEYSKSTKINPYYFVKVFSKLLKRNSIVVTGNGTAVVTAFQAFEIKNNLRLWSNSGCAAMGYDLPAAIGASVANSNKEVFCITGDGSIMMNIQELQTIAGYNLPIKVILLNNLGYSSIFQTQKNFFKGMEFGAGPNSGVSFPSFKDLCKGFKIKYQKCSNTKQLSNSLKKLIRSESSYFLELIIDQNQVFAPKLGAKQHPDGSITSPPLEDMSPFLSDDELSQNMLNKDK